METTIKTATQWHLEIAESIKRIQEVEVLRSIYTLIKHTDASVRPSSELNEQEMPPRNMERYPDMTAEELRKAIQESYESIKKDGLITTDEARKRLFSK